MWTGGRHVATFIDALDRETKRKMAGQARTAVEAVAGEEQIELVGVSSDGKQVAALGPQRLLLRNGQKEVHELDLAMLHSVVALDSKNATSKLTPPDAILAALVRGEAFVPVKLRTSDATQMAQAVRVHLTALRSARRSMVGRSGRRPRYSTAPSGNARRPRRMPHTREDVVFGVLCKHRMAIQTAPEITAGELKGSAHSLGVLAMLVDSTGEGVDGAAECGTAGVGSKVEGAGVAAARDRRAAGVFA